MSETTPRERRQQRTYDAILEASRQILSEDGVNALSMREIARRIEYSPAALYEYFGSKEEIIGALCDEGFRRLTLQLRSTATELPPEEYLLEMGRNYVRFALANPDYFSLMFGNFSQTLAAAQVTDWKPFLRESAAFGELEGAMRRLAADKIIDAPDEEAIFDHAISIWQIVHGVATLGISFGSTSSEYSNYIERGLRDHLDGVRNRRMK